MGWSSSSVAILWIAQRSPWKIWRSGVEGMVGPIGASCRCFYMYLTFACMPSSEYERGSHLESVKQLRERKNFYKCSARILMYSHRQSLGARPRHAPPLSLQRRRCHWKSSSDANLKAGASTEKKNRYAEYGTVFPPNAMTVKSNDLCVVSP